MTTEEKLQACVTILELMCKPAEECNAADIEELEKFIGEDEMAYDTLVKIGRTPRWSRPNVDEPRHCHLILPPGDYQISMTHSEKKPNLKLVK